MTGVIAGTPGYMSPEMGLGSPDVDWRSDIYSLGCVAYWLLTGRRVFEEGTSMQILMDHVQKPPTPPSEWVGGRSAAGARPDRPVVPREGSRQPPADGA